MSIDKQKVNAAAQKHIQKGNYDKAIRELRKIVEADPNDVRTLLKIGDLFTRKGENEMAIETYYQVTNYYRERGFYLKAVAVLKQVVKLAPNRLDVLEDLGELYASQGLQSDALSQYRQVLSVYQERKQSADQQRVLARMCRIDPANVGLRIKLAEHLSRANSAEEAAEQFRIAATQLRNEKRTDDYIRVAERLLYHRPDDEGTLRELVEVYLEQGQARRGLGKLQKLYKIDPKNVETLGLLTQAFMALNQNSKAASVLKEMAKIQEESDPNASLGTWRRALALTPNDPEVLAALQRHNFTLSGEVPSIPAEAIPAEPEEEDDDDFVASLLTECDSFIRLNLLNQALENIEKIFEIDSGNLEAHERRVTILLKQGEDLQGRDALINMAKLSFALDRSRAIEYLAQAAEIDPVHQETRELVMAFGLNPDDFGLHDPTQQRLRPEPIAREPRRSPPPPRRSAPDRSTSDFPKLQLSTIEDELDRDLDEWSNAMQGLGSSTPESQEATPAEPTAPVEPEPPPAPPESPSKPSSAARVQHQLRPDSKEIPKPKPSPALNDGLDDMLGGLDFSIDFGTDDSASEEPAAPPPSEPLSASDSLEDSFDLDLGGALDDFDFSAGVERALDSSPNLTPVAPPEDPGLPELSEAEAEILAEDIQEAEFFANQGMVGEARQLLADLVSNYGERPELVALQSHIDAL